MNLQLKPEVKAELDKKARELGLSPTRFLTRKIMEHEAAPQVTAEDIADKVAERLRGLVTAEEGRVCAELAEPDRIKLEALAQFMGVGTSTNLLTSLAFWAMSNPQDVQKLLREDVDELERSLGARARAPKGASTGRSKKVAA